MLTPTQSGGGYLVQVSDFSGSTEVVNPIAQSHRTYRRFLFYRDFFKRLVDLAIVAATAPLAVPMIVLLALAIAADGHNPFFLQARIGRGGRVFRILKLRTMVPGAEAMLEDFLAADPEAARQWASRQKLDDDPRITKIGRVLRRFSLDELPQLWNVFRGDMSLVGPRPMLVCQQRLYPGREYYRMRPGITGLWQVSERHGSEFIMRAKYDRDYSDCVSLWTDLAVLARTLVVVARATGC